MSTVIRNVLAVIAGLVVGSCVNMGFIFLGPMLIPLPDGVDMRNADSLASGIRLFEPRHFIAPFLAHALGTLVGVGVACVVAASHKPVCGWIVGVAFLCGGVMASIQIPAPLWFIALDLLLAYLPMAWLGIRLGARATRPDAAG